MKLTLQDLSKSFGGHDIFSHFSLEVDSGMRLCVCGPNGTGKSTLLRIMAGLEEPDAGKVILPKGCRLGYVEQELSDEALHTQLLTYVLDVLLDWQDFWTQWEEAASEKDERRLKQLMQTQSELERSYGYNPEQRAKKVLSGLGFSESKWQRCLGELSGGWRERAKLARVLTAGADVLLLDEPTNHLDIDAVEWLEEFLLAFQGVLIFVAHDRRFMDTIANHVLYLGLSKPIFRKTNYTQFLTLQEEYNAQRERERQALQDELSRKMAFVDRFRAKATKARQASSHQKMAKRLERNLGIIALSRNGGNCVFAGLKRRMWKKSFWRFQNSTFISLMANISGRSSPLPFTAATALPWWDTMAAANLRCSSCSQVI